MFYLQIIILVFIGSITLFSKSIILKFDNDNNTYQYYRIFEIEGSNEEPVWQEITYGQSDTMHLKKTSSLINVMVRNSANTTQKSRLFEFDTNNIIVGINKDGVYPIIETEFQKVIDTTLSKTALFKKMIAQEQNETQKNELIGEYLALLDSILIKYPKNLSPYILYFDAMPSMNSNDLLKLKISLKRYGSEELLQNKIIKQLSDVLNLQIQNTKGANIDLFSLKNEIGEEIDISQIEKKYILLDFWASWCGPCIKQIPSLNLLQSQFNNNLQVISISIDKDESKWKKLLTRFDKGILNLVDDEKAKIQENLGITRIPYNLLINKSGEIILINETPERIKEYLINEK